MQAIKILPLENRILVSPIEDDLDPVIRRTETEDKKRPEKGKVVAVGDEYKGILKKGDMVYYQKFDVEKMSTPDKRTML